jgi:type IV pilus assembly protein PilO
MTKSKQWTIGAALAVLLVLAAGFLLLVQPQRSEAASLQEQTAQQEAAADALRTKLNQLKVQEQDLPRQQAKLEEIRSRLPDTPALPSLIRSLTDAAEASGAELTTLAPSAPVEVASTSGSATAVKPQAAVDAAAGSAAAAAPAQAQAQSVLKQIPLSIEVTGSYATLTAFVTQLEGLQRSMLVTGVNIAAEGDTSSDPLTLNLSAAVFMTAEEAAPQAITPTPAADAAAE